MLQASATRLESNYYFKPEGQGFLSGGVCYEAEIDEHTRCHFSKGSQVMGAANKTVYCVQSTVAYVLHLM